MSIVKYSSVSQTPRAAATHLLDVPQRDPTAKQPSKLTYFVQLLTTSTPLAVADVAGVFISLAVSAGMASALSLHVGLQIGLLFPFLSLAVVAVYSLFDLYPGTGIHPIAELRQLCVATLVVFLGFLCATAVSGTFIDAILLCGSCVLSICLSPLLRSAARTIAARFSFWGHPVLIFGDPQEAVDKYHFLKRHRRLGLRPVGIVGHPPHRSLSYGDFEGYLGPLEAAESIAIRHSVFWAVVAMPDRSPTEVRQVIERYARTIPHLLVIPDMEKLPSLWTRAYDCAGAPAIRIQTSLLLPLPQFIKRAIDVTAVVVGGLLCLPLITTLALLVRISSSGPIFYGHERITRGGRRFRAWKLRTMIQNADQVLEEYLDANPQMRDEWERDQKLRNDPRVTAIGTWLRKTSLDELPQIWNVLMGEMSLVGPRPIVTAEAVRYEDCLELYVKVLPGITGLWQISGRNNTTYAERIALDSYYVRNWSPWMDLYILARTVKVVINREGAY